MLILSQKYLKNYAHWIETINAPRRHGRNKVQSLSEERNGSRFFSSPVYPLTNAKYTFHYKLLRRHHFSSKPRNHYEFQILTRIHSDLISFPVSWAVSNSSHRRCRCARRRRRCRYPHRRHFSGRRQQQKIGLLAAGASNVQNASRSRGQETHEKEKNKRRIKSQKRVALLRLKSKGKICDTDCIFWENRGFRDYHVIVIKRIDFILQIVPFEESCRCLMANVYWKIDGQNVPK